MLSNLTHDFQTHIFIAFLTKETSYEPKFIYQWFQDLLEEIDEHEDRVVFIFLDDIHRLVLHFYELVNILAFG